MDNDKFIRLVAELLAKTQVLRSIGALRGANAEWDQLRTEMKLFGWMDADEIESRIKSVLNPEAIS